MNEDFAYGLGMTAVASLCWSGLDASRKVLVERMRPAVLLVGLSSGQALLFGGWALAWGHRIESPQYWGPGLLAMALNVVGNLMFFVAVRVSPLSLVVPLLAFVPVFTVLAANLLLGELPTPRQLGGLGVVVLGALVLNAGEARGRTLAAVVRALVEQRGTAPMLVTALCWSVSIVVDKVALAHAGFTAHGAVLNAGLLAAGILLLAARGQLGELRGLRTAWRPLLLATALAAGGLGAQLIAVRHLLVALVEATKRAVGVTLAVVAGRLLFGEPVSAPKVVAVLLMSAGAGLLAWT